MPEIEVPAWKCERCGHLWVKRPGRKPTICPKCKSPYWDRERVVRASMKVEHIADAIRRLNREELASLNERLRDLGIPPLESTGVPAKPKSGPPSLEAEATLEEPNGR